MATCSNMADPVLVFQLPDIDVLLPNNQTDDLLHGHSQCDDIMEKLKKFLHVGLVVVTNLLDSNVILGIDKRLRCGIRFRQSHNTSNVLEIILIVHFYLYTEFNSNTL